MPKYGKVAIYAYKLLEEHRADSPQDAWDQAVAEFFDSESSRAKSCPKSTFLGLCSEGLVVGVQPGDYSKSNENKHYAVEAIKRLDTEPDLAADPKQLWSLVAGNKKHNSQMDVVVSLWQSRMTRRAGKG